MDPQTQYNFSIDQVDASTQDEMVRFLKHHEDRTLFLLNNFENHGYRLTRAFNSGNFHLIRYFGNIVGAFCLCRRGNLLIQSEENNDTLMDLVLDACLRESIPLTGLLGDWDFCHPFWEHLKKRKVIRHETLISKEVLYSLDISRCHYPTEPTVRLLTTDDFSQWHPLRNDYLQEMKLPEDLSEKDLYRDFLSKVEQKITWGLFRDRELRSLAEFNAKTTDLAQVGGVYTIPSLRGQGLAKTLMRQLVTDAKNLHRIRKLIIFTDQDNKPARSVYESLGANHIGYYALLFATIDPVSNY